LRGGESSEKLNIADILYEKDFEKGCTEVFGMKIEGSRVKMQAASTHNEEYVKQERLKVWVDDANKPAVPSDVIQISEQGLTAQKTEAHQPKEEELLADKDYLKLKLLEAVLSKISGHDYKFSYVAVELKKDCTEGKFDNTFLKVTEKEPPQLQNNTGEGWGLDYHFSEQYTETERMSFRANASVAIKDGRQIDFSIAFQMSRSYSESFSMDIKAGDALKDPLAIDLTGKGIAFSGKTMHFDLDLDGKRTISQF